MRYTSAVMVLLAMLFCGSGHAQGQPRKRSAPASDPLVVSLMVPDLNPVRGDNLIDLSDSNFHFCVVIKNISSRPVQLLASGDPVGCEIISLEVLAIQNHPIVPPQTLAIKNPGISAWGGPRAVTVEPGQLLVRELYLRDDAYNLGSFIKRFKTLEAFPFPKTQYYTPMTIRAVLDERSLFGQPIRPPNSLGLWIGKVVSEPSYYTAYLSQKPVKKPQ